jgi:hypothetical protein
MSWKNRTGSGSVDPVTKTNLGYGNYSIVLISFNNHKYNLTVQDFREGNFSVEPVRAPERYVKINFLPLPH